MASLIPDPVLRLLDAINTGDSAAFMACFAEDAQVDAQGHIFEGLQAISAWNEAENIGMHNRVEIIAARTD